MTLDQIVAMAGATDANQFAKFLDEYGINWTALDVNIMDYNQDYFNITLDDFDDENICFVDGKFID